MGCGASTEAPGGRSRGPSFKRPQKLNREALLRKIFAEIADTDSCTTVSVTEYKEVAAAHRELKLQLQYGTVLLRRRILLVATGSLSSLCLWLIMWGSCSCGSKKSPLDTSGWCSNGIPLP